ncbi:MAG: response regulator [Pelomonas sp.]|nr:response regulator [Roseateles sp.]
MARHTQLMLRRGGIAGTCLEMGSGAAALDYLRRAPRHGLDLLLLDLHMPDLGGFDVLAAYEGLPAQQRAKVLVVLSASSLASDIERAMLHPCVADYLLKPLDGQQIHFLALLMQSQLARQG